MATSSTAMNVPISTTPSTSQRRKSVIACLAASNDARFRESASIWYRFAAFSARTLSY
jgi:hypothetical protein